MEENLESLRNRMREIDLSLVALAAERVQVARALGEIKRGQNLPVVDYAQERIVLERAARAAERHGIDPRVAQDLVARLIRASVTVQEEDRLRLAATGAGKTAVVVGGGGRMGRWFVRFLGAQGYAAGALDPAATAEENSWATERFESADLILCAAPPEAVAQLYREWLSRPPRGVTFDIASIKTPLLGPIRELQARGVRVASIHPMFGPGIALLRDADVVVCDTGDEVAEEAVEELFRPTTARLVRIPLEEHDRIMGDLLSLAHAAAIAFALSLPEELHPVRSTTFHALEALAAEVVRESPEVYYEIQSGNPYSASALKKLDAALRRIAETVEAGSFDGFRALLLEGQRRTSKRDRGAGI